MVVSYPWVFRTGYFVRSELGQRPSPELMGDTSSGIYRPNWALRESQAESGFLWSEIEAIIGLRREMVRYCYSREHRKDSTLAGSVKVEFKVGEDGTVEKNMTWENSTGNDALVDCIENVILSYLFPKPVGGGEVTVPYQWTFRPSPPPRRKAG